MTQPSLHNFFSKYKNKVNSLICIFITVTVCETFQSQSLCFSQSSLVHENNSMNFYIEKDSWFCL